MSKCEHAFNTFDIVPIDACGEKKKLANLHCFKCKMRKEDYEYIKQLEAENKKLREALEKYVGVGLYNRRLYEGEYVTKDFAKEALEGE